MGCKPTRILIVEDNPDHAELMKEVLLKHNNRFEINTAVFGEECLAMLDKGDYDVVLSDYTLPKLYGLEVLKEIIEKGCHLILDINNIFYYHTLLYHFPDIFSGIFRER